MDYIKSHLESVGRRAFVVLCRVLRQNVTLMGLSLSVSIFYLMWVRLNLLK